MTSSRVIIRKALDLLTLGIPGTATSGSAAALGDSALTFGNGYFNGGILDGDTIGSSGSAAVDFGGLFKITTFSANIFTLTPSLPSWSGSAMTWQVGDDYTAWNQYSMDEMIRAINFALQDCGLITDWIETTSVASQTEYTLSGTDPNGDTRTAQNVVRVTLATSTTDDTEVEQVGNWREAYGKIVFQSALTAGLTLRIYYNRTPDDVSYVFTPGTTQLADVSEQIDELRLVWLTAYYAARARRMRVETDDPRLLEFLQQAAAMNARLQRERPNRIIQKPARLAWL